MVWLGFFAGSFLGGLVPNLWGSGYLSVSSILFTAVGSLIGIWAGYKISQF